MNLSEVKKEIRGLDKFEFETLTPATASVIVYGSDKYLEEFTKPGLYCVRSGSRGIIEQVELLGSSADSFNVPSLEEAKQSLVEGATEEEIEAANEYVDEFYMVVEDAEYPGVLNFGFTEEEFDYFFMVG